jgi:hypothetical protein
MSGHDDPITQSEGPSPTEEDDDPGRSLEDFISGMDRPLGVDDSVTLDEQAHGDTIDEFNRREERTSRRAGSSVDMIDDSDAEGYDGTGEMVGDIEPGEEGPPSPEQAAMHIVDEAPGGVDHPDDYVDPDTR